MYVYMILCRQPHHPMPWCHGPTSTPSTPMSCYGSSQVDCLHHPMAHPAPPICGCGVVLGWGAPPPHGMLLRDCGVVVVWAGSHLERPDCWHICFCNVWTSPMDGIFVFVAFGAPPIVGISVLVTLGAPQWLG